MPPIPKGWSQEALDELELDEDYDPEEASVNNTMGSGIVRESYY